MKPKTIKMSELQKLESFRYALAVAETFDEIKLINGASSAMAELSKKARFSLEKQNELGLFRVEIMEKVGEWLEEHHPHGNNQYSGGTVIQPPKMPVSKNESSQSRLVKNEPELKEEVILEIVQKGNVVTPNKVANGIRKKLKNIAIVPIDISPNQVSIDDFIEVETEEQEVENKPKRHTLKIFNLPTDHPNEEIRTLIGIFLIIDKYSSIKDLKNFLEYLLNSKLESYEN